MCMNVGTEICMYDINHLSYSDSDAMRSVVGIYLNAMLILCMSGRRVGINRLSGY
jgi:hypothetical protein